MKKCKKQSERMVNKIYKVVDMSSYILVITICKQRWRKKYVNIDQKKVGVAIMSKNKT